MDNKDLELYNRRKQTVYEFICDDDYPPMKFKEMCTFLQVPGDERQTFLDILKDVYKRQLKCTLVSDVDRVVKVAVMTPSAGYAWHGGEDVVLTAGEAKDVTLTITPKEEVFTDGITVDTGAGLFFSMGYVEGYTLGAHTVSISNVSFVKN